MWKTSPVWCTLDDAIAVSTVIESTLIKERALAIGSTGVELSVPSTIAFLVCVPALPEQTKQNMFFCIAPL